MYQDSLVFCLTTDDVLTAPPVCGLLTIPDFLRQVQRWCVQGGPALIVDLSHVRETEMAVFRALIWARRHCRAHGRDFQVVEPPVGVLPPRAERLLRDLLPFQPDLASAKSASATRQDPLLEPVA